MRAGATIAAAVLVAVASCRRMPEDLSSPEAGPASFPANAASPAGPDASAGPSAGPAPAGDPVRAFCTEAFLADSKRNKAACSPGDAARLQSLGHIAADLCAHDFTIALAGSRATFDAEAAAECAHLLRENPLTRADDADTFFAHFPCDKVLVGTQSVGKPCRSAVDCKDGLACLPARLGGAAVCRVPGHPGSDCARQAVGATFNDAAAEVHHPACARGAWCDGRTCQRRLSPGKDCTRSEACPEGLACVTGRCGQRHRAGGACTKAGDCEFGLWCAAPGGSCAAKLPEGTECRPGDVCKGRCDTTADAGAGLSPGRGMCVSVCGSG